MDNKPVKTTLGLDENVESALCYAGIWVTGLLFFLLEKDSKKVRFHALQSLIAFLCLTIVTYIVGRFSFFGYLLWLATILLWVLLMVKAFQGERFKLPRIGDFVEGIVGGVDSAVVPEPPPQQPAQAPAAQAEAVPVTETAAAPGTSDKEAVLKAVEQILSQYHELTVARSSQTDLEIKSVPGAKQIDYSACLLARDDERLVLYWEMMKESGVKQDFQPQDKSFAAEKNGLNGRKAAGLPLDFEQTRGIVENAVKSSGWAFRTVLGKSKAMYPK